MKDIIQLLSNKGGGQISLDLDYKPGLALLLIDHPERHNALTGKMMVEFNTAITQLEDNIESKDLVAVIAMGKGRTFCSGLDLKFAQELKIKPEESVAMYHLMHDSVERLSRLPIITMAVVTGGAIGGGSEILTGFDYICMSRASSFVYFVQTRMGVSSPLGGLRRLTQLVGRKKALKWMAGGYRLDANTCFKEGFADVLVEKDDECLEGALKFLKHFMVDERTGKVSSRAVRGMKKLAVRQMKENDWEYENKVLSSTTFSSKL